MLFSKPLKESFKDYSLASALFVFGLFLLWLAFYVNDFFVMIGGIISILAGIASVILMGYFQC